MKRVVAVLMALAGVASASARAEEVKIPFRGLTMVGNLELAAGKQPKDGMLLITHGTLAHGGMEIIAKLQETFKEKGRSSLAINLSLGLSERRGMYECPTPHTHRYGDALDEIGAWMAWLGTKGVKEVVLMGHSLGGNQTARYAAERDTARIRSVVLLAPATYDEKRAAAGYEQRYKVPLKSVLDKAQSLARAGKGETRLTDTDFLYCPKATVTAASFVSYYTPDPQRDTPALLPRIPKPVLVVAASNDETITDLVEKARPRADGKRVQLKVIDGADHFFRDLYAEDAVDVIVAFLGAR